MPGQRSILQCKRKLDQNINLFDDNGFDYPSAPCVPPGNDDRPDNDHDCI